MPGIKINSLSSQTHPEFFAGGSFESSRGSNLLNDDDQHA